MNTHQAVFLLLGLCVVVVLAVLLGAVAAVAGRYVRVLRQVTADPGVRVGRVDVLLPGERAAVSGAAAPTPGPTAQLTVPELIWPRVVAAPDAVAVVCGDRSLTYRQLWWRARRLAHVAALRTARGSPPAERTTAVRTPRPSSDRDRDRDSRRHRTPARGARSRTVSAGARLDRAVARARPASPAGFRAGFRPPAGMR